METADFILLFDISYGLDYYLRFDYSPYGHFKKGFKLKLFGILVFTINRGRCQYW